jgi:hypothetical protein
VGEVGLGHGQGCILRLLSLGDESQDCSTSGLGREQVFQNCSQPDCRRRSHARTSQRTERMQHSHGGRADLLRFDSEADLEQSAQVQGGRIPF